MGNETLRGIRTDANLYNADYFERGPVLGISGYMNYSWMPELTVRMAHYLISSLPIQRNERVLDFGCAKGFLVRALRILDIDAFGVDLSRYAIDCVDTAVKEHCRLVTGCSDPILYERPIDWLLAKDVFEHIGTEDLQYLLKRSRETVRKQFVVVPLAADDTSDTYIVPEYNRDITHVVAKSKDWWSRLFTGCGWEILSFSHSFRGCKENWTSAFNDGNGFFILGRNQH